MSAVTQELVEGFKNWHYWFGLGWSDIKRRYVRTLLGPWWSVVNAVIFIGAVGYVYSSLFNAELADVLPHLAAGYFVWMLITSITNESCSVLHAQGIVIKTSPVRPISLILRMAARNFMIFGHNFLLLFFMAVVYSSNFALFPLSILGVVLLVLFLVPVSIIVAISCCRFRDLEQLIGNAMMIFFFITPVLWKPELLNGRAVEFVQYNIFFHFIEVVRRPMLGEFPTSINYFVCIGIIIMVMAIAIFMYSGTRKRLAFWF